MPKKVNLKKKATQKVRFRENPPDKEGPVDEAPEPRKKGTVREKLAFRERGYDRNPPTEPAVPKPPQQDMQDAYHKRGQTANGLSRWQREVQLEKSKENISGRRKSSLRNDIIQSGGSEDNSDAEMEKQRLQQVQLLKEKKQKNKKGSAVSKPVVPGPVEKKVQEKVARLHHKRSHSPESTSLPGAFSVPQSDVPSGDVLQKKTKRIRIEDYRARVVSAEIKKREGVRALFEIDQKKKAEEARENARGKSLNVLYDLLLSEMIQMVKNFEVVLGESQTEETWSRELARRLEESINNDGKTELKAYTTKFLAVRFNLRENKRLLEFLIAGSITPEHLATLSTEQMATEDKKMWRQEQRELATAAITIVKEPQQPRIRKGHKGDELVEDIHRRSSSVSVSDSLFSPHGTSTPDAHERQSTPESGFCLANVHAQIPRKNYPISEGNPRGQGITKLRSPVPRNNLPDIDIPDICETNASILFSGSIKDPSSLPASERGPDTLDTYQHLDTRNGSDQVLVDESEHVRHFSEPYSPPHAVLESRRSSSPSYSPSDAEWVMLPRELIDLTVEDEAGEDEPRSLMNHSTGAQASTPHWDTGSHRSNYTMHDSRNLTETSLEHYTQVDRWSDNSAGIIRNRSDTEAIYQDTPTETQNSQYTYYERENQPRHTNHATHQMIYDNQPNGFGSQDNRYDAQDTEAHNNSNGYSERWGNNMGHDGGRKVGQFGFSVEGNGYRAREYRPQSIHRVKHQQELPSSAQGATGGQHSSQYQYSAVQVEVNFSHHESTPMVYGFTEASGFHYPAQGPRNGFQHSLVTQSYIPEQAQTTESSSQGVLEYSTSTARQCRRTSNPPYTQHDDVPDFNSSTMPDNYHYATRSGAAQFGDYVNGPSMYPPRYSPYQPGQDPRYH